jgi:hypothetical protein
MNYLLELLIVKPFEALISWVKSHWLIAAFVWLVIWFLPPLGIVLYAVAAKAIGESAASVFVNTRWARVAFVLAFAIAFPPLGVVFTSWLLIDLLKPDDRITTKILPTLEDIAGNLKRGISGLFDRGTPPAPVANPAATAPTTPPPNPVVSGDIGINPNIGIDDSGEEVGGLT